MIVIVIVAVVVVVVVVVGGGGGVLFGDMSFSSPKENRTIFSRVTNTSSSGPRNQRNSNQGCKAKKRKLRQHLGRFSC